MNINDNTNTLDMMRQELSDFKSVLKEQKIFNEKIIRRSIQNDYSKERKNILVVGLLALVALPVYAVITFVLKAVPVWFFLITIFYLALCAAFTAYSIKRYVSDDIMTQNVVSVAENLNHYKRLNNRWIVYFGIPTLVVWLSLFFYVIGQNGGDFARGMVYGGIVGLFCGSACGIVYYVQSMRRINRLLAYIEEIKATGNV